ncbi:hypothetical protein DACRYDRAFT_24079 [Dacryopinax primogenitus]|uniref:Uncharacterized protein n=1 Tax=Dacryopinax primogenitus (strain DJM 731) TaxID=1858805 RepID=M5FU09_DACPD|nr:uncharacterized protein DACRYDRAFT_24079 [Dacryopinax primogenitus]EJT98974.1 hypothetical protein DACRYDRAFT_24079 [Dacryopinax primogenitus]
MLIACDENYVPRWSPGARRKKERDEKEALAWSPSEVHSIDLMLSAGYHPFVFGGARVDEVEVKRGKGAPTRLDVESEKTEEVTESDESDMLVSPVEHDVSIPFGPHKYPSVMSPSAEDRAFADILPVSICRPLQGERPISPPTTSPEKINGRRLSFTERSSLMLQACLRGGSTVLKSVASGEGNMNVKLL